MSNNKYFISRLVLVTQKNLNNEHVEFLELLCDSKINRGKNKDSLLSVLNWKNCIMNMNEKVFKNEKSIL